VTRERENSSLVEGESLGGFGVFGYERRVWEVLGFSDMKDELIFCGLEGTKAMTFFVVLS
jgi:hypothetical protein